VHGKAIETWPRVPLDSYRIQRALSGMKVSKVRAVGPSELGAIAAVEGIGENGRV
jgi:hypothetical protein